MILEQNPSNFVKFGRIGPNSKTFEGTLASCTGQQQQCKRTYLECFLLFLNSPFPFCDSVIFPCLFMGGGMKGGDERLLPPSVAMFCKYAVYRFLMIMTGSFHHLWLAVKVFELIPVCQNLACHNTNITIFYWECEPWFGQTNIHIASQSHVLIKQHLKFIENHRIDSCNYSHNIQIWESTSLIELHR